MHTTMKNYMRFKVCASVIFFLPYISLSTAERSCKTADGKFGKCKPISDCPKSNPIINLGYRDKNQFQFPKQSVCQNRNGKLFVCCETCITPDNATGVCINRTSCYNFLEIESLPIPHSQEISTYLKQSRCHGNDLVCCSKQRPSILKAKNTVSVDAVCGIENNYNKANIIQYPWVAYIEYEKKSNTWCAGNLISEYYVITTAKCVSGGILKKFGSTLKVRLGDVKLSNNDPSCVKASGQNYCHVETVTIPIQRVIFYSKSKIQSNRNTLKNDIALLRLKSSAPFTDFIRPVCIPKFDNADEIKKMNELFIIPRSNSVSAEMLHTRVPLINKNNCQSILSREHIQFKLLHDNICVNSYSDSCKTHYGEPLMYQRENGGSLELVGIVSYGPCYKRNKIRIYTKIFDYLEWINSFIRS